MHPSPNWDAPETAGLVQRLFSAAGEPEQALETRVSELISHFLGDTRVCSDASFDALSASFTTSVLPAEPTHDEDYLEYLERDVVAHSINTSSPTYIGHMTSALPYFTRPLSRLVSALNQNVVKVETARALTPYERQTLAMLHRLVFARDDAFYAEHVQNRRSTLGMVTSGGTLANVTALWVARNASLGPQGDFPGLERAGLMAALEHRGARRAVLIGSSLMHYSLQKAADVLGLGTQNVIQVGVDERSRMKVDELRRVVEDCRRHREHIVAIVGVAGTTDSGGIDPLEEIAQVAREAGTHFHVDAAWGGPTLFSDTHRHLLRGIELADSVTIDGHKQLYVPMGLGMVLLKDPRAAVSIEKQAPYIIRANSPDLGRRSLEGSRPAAVLYLHAALHLLGRRGYAHLIDEGIRKTSYLADTLRARPEFELMAEPSMNILNYRYVPTALRERVRQGVLGPAEDELLSRFNERLQEAQSAAGRTFVSRTTLRHTRYGLDRPLAVLRAVLANPLTTERHIDAVLDDQVRIASTLEGA
ncbi:MAG TPA: putative pyridoxal-dependent aspartate 1-decarboxylase [Archangium sp.]|nr:putative pyridoxal-dependent aspartate 1-decarboxylase [Archangium sp.]